MYPAIDIIVLGVRALSFVAVFQAVGACLFLQLFERELRASADAVRSFVRWSALTAVTLTMLYHFLVPVRMAGSFTAFFDTALSEIVMQSNIGPAHATRFVGLALLAVSLDPQNSFHKALCLVGVGLAMLSFALMGHTSIHSLTLVLAPSLLLHVAAAAFWFGSLHPLRTVTLRESPERRDRIIASFSSYAVFVVPLLFVCGAVMAALFLQSPSQIWTPYGSMIVLKTIGFTALLALAAVNRTRLTPAIAAGNPRSLRVFRRVLALEWVLIAGVLVATAYMTGLFAPENLHATFGEPHEVLESHD